MILLLHIIKKNRNFDFINFNSEFIIKVLNGDIIAIEKKSATIEVVEGLRLVGVASSIDADSRYIRFKRE